MPKRILNPNISAQNQPAPILKATPSVHASPGKKTTPAVHACAATAVGAGAGAEAGASAGAAAGASARASATARACSPHRKRAIRFPAT